MNEMVGAVEGQAVEEPDFAPLQILAELEAQAMKPMPAVLPDMLAWKDIRQVPELFQARTGKLNQHHVGELVSAIGRSGALDPVTVIQIGPEAVLIEGHHRMAAYSRAGFTESIPVSYFTGTVKDAVREAGRANSRAKLPMPLQERQNYAWKLVKMGCYTKAQIRDAANISDGQVGIMRRVRKALGEAATDHEHWWQAQRAAKGIESLTWDADEIDAKKEEWAQKYAERLHKSFSNQLTQNPEIAARALALHFGDALGEVYRELAGHVGKLEDESDEDDF